MKVPNMCIDVRNNGTLDRDLSTRIQQLLFKHNIVWRDNGKALLYYDTRYLKITDGKITGSRSQDYQLYTLKQLKTILKEDTDMFDSLKSYLKENQNTIFTIIALAIIDQYFLKGRLTDKLQKLVDKILGNCEAKLLEEKK